MEAIALSEIVSFSGSPYFFVKAFLFDEKMLFYWNPNFF